MTTEGADVFADEESFYARERHAIDLAADQIKRYAIFSRVPMKDAAGMLVVGYERKIGIVGVSEEEADIMLRNDLADVLRAIRRNVFGAPKLSEARLAVVAHLCLLLGVEHVRQLGEFWRAIAANDYETAADEMMLSAWPRFIGEQARDKQRALDLLFMMRTGQTRPPRANGDRQQ